MLFNFMINKATNPHNDYQSIVHEYRPDDNSLRELCGNGKEYEDVREKLDLTNGLYKGGVYVTSGLMGPFKDILHVRLVELNKLKELYEHIIFTAEALDMKTLGIPVLGLDHYSYEDSYRILVSVLHASNTKIKVTVIHNFAYMAMGSSGSLPKFLSPDDANIFNFVHLQDRSMNPTEMNRVLEFYGNLDPNKFFHKDREYRYPMDFVYDFIETNNINPNILNLKNADLDRRKKSKMSAEPELAVKDLLILIFILSLHGLNKHQAIQLLLLNGSMLSLTRPIDKAMMDYLDGKLNNIKTLQDMNEYVYKISGGRETFTFANVK